MRGKIIIVLTRFNSKFKVFKRNGKMSQPRGQAEGIFEIHPHSIKLIKTGDTEQLRCADQIFTDIKASEKL